MPANLHAEQRFLQRFRIGIRCAVALGWLAALTILCLRGIPEPLATTAVFLFKITAVGAALWLLIEIVEALLNRTRALNPSIDALLTLPMLAFWYLAWVSSF